MARASPRGSPYLFEPLTGGFPARRVRPESPGTSRARRASLVRHDERGYGTSRGPGLRAGGVHDAFVKVIGRFGEIRAPDAFGAYLKRTVINLANSFFRRRKLEREHLESEGRSIGIEPADDHDPIEREALWRPLSPYRSRSASAISRMI